MKYNTPKTAHVKPIGRFFGENRVIPALGRGALRACRAPSGLTGLIAVLGTQGVALGFILSGLRPGRQKPSQGVGLGFILSGRWPEW